MNWGLLTFYVSKETSLTTLMMLVFPIPSSCLNQTLPPSLPPCLSSSPTYFSHTSRPPSRRLSQCQCHMCVLYSFPALFPGLSPLFNHLLLARVKIEYLARNACISEKSSKRSLLGYKEMREEVGSLYIDSLASKNAYNVH